MDVFVDLGQDARWNFKIAQIGYGVVSVDLAPEHAITLAKAGSDSQRQENDCELHCGKFSILSYIRRSTAVFYMKFNRFLNEIPYKEFKKNSPK